MTMNESLLLQAIRRSGKTQMAMAAYQAELYAALVASVVDSKLNELATIPHGPETGRRLQIGGRTPEQIHEYLRATFTDVAHRLGVDLFRQTPAIVLDQLAVMSATKKHDAAGMLRNVINGFLSAYSTPETSDRAYEHLEGLGALRAEVAAGRAAQATKH
jgi:hypothetical protein